MYTQNDLSSNVSNLTISSNAVKKKPIAVTTVAPESNSKARETNKKIAWDMLKLEVDDFETKGREKFKKSAIAWGLAEKLMAFPEWEPTKVISFLEKAFEGWDSVRKEAQDLIPKIRHNKQGLGISKPNQSEGSPWKKFVDTKKTYTTTTDSCHMMQALIHMTKACEIWISLPTETKEKLEPKQKEKLQPQEKKELQPQKKEELQPQEKKILQQLSEHYKQAIDALIPLKVNQELPYPKVANNSMEKATPYLCTKIIVELSQLDYDIRQALESAITKDFNKKNNTAHDTLNELLERIDAHTSKKHEIEKEAFVKAFADSRNANTSAAELMSHLDQTQNRFNTIIGHFKNVEHFFTDEFSGFARKHKSALDEKDMYAMDVHCKHVGLVTMVMSNGIAAYPTLEMNLGKSLDKTLLRLSYAHHLLASYNISEAYRHWEAGNSKVRENFKDHKQWSQGDNLPPGDHCSNEGRFRLLRHLPAIYEEIATRLLPFSNRMEDELQQIEKTIVDINDKLAALSNDSVTDASLNTNKSSIKSFQVSSLEKVHKVAQEHKDFYQNMPEQLRDLAVSLHVLAKRIRYELDKLADAGISRNLKTESWELEFLDKIKWNADAEADVSQPNANHETVKAKVEQLAEKIDELIIDSKASATQSAENISLDAIDKEKKTLQKRIQRLEKKASESEQSAQRIENELNDRMKAWDAGTQNPKNIFDKHKYNPFEIESCLNNAAQTKIRIAESLDQLADKCAADDNKTKEQHINRAGKLRDDASKLQTRAVDKKVKWIMALPTPANINHLFREELITDVGQPRQLKDWKRTPSEDGVTGEVVRNDDDTPLEDRVIEFTIIAKGDHRCVIHFHYPEENPVPGVTPPSWAHYKTWTQARMSMRSERKDISRIAGAPEVKIWYGVITDNRNEYALQLMNALPENKRSVILPKNK